MSIAQLLPQICTPASVVSAIQQQTADVHRHHTACSQLSKNRMPSKSPSPCKLITARLCRTQARSNTFGASLSYGENPEACSELPRFLCTGTPSRCLQKGVTEGARMLKRENTQGLSPSEQHRHFLGLISSKVYQHKESKCYKWWSLPTISHVKNIVSAGSKTRLAYPLKWRSKT